MKTVSRSALHVNIAFVRSFVFRNGAWIFGSRVCRRRFQAISDFGWLFAIRRFITLVSGFDLILFFKKKKKSIALTLIRCRSRGPARRRLFGRCMETTQAKTTRMLRLRRFVMQRGFLTSHPRLHMLSCFRSAYLQQSSLLPSRFSGRRGSAVSGSKTAAALSGLVRAGLLRSD